MIDTVVQKRFIGLNDMIKKMIVLSAIAVLFATSVLAKPRSTDAPQISRAVKASFPSVSEDRYPFVMNRISIAGDYALVSWTQGEMGGAAALKKQNGKWLVVTSGGGEIPAKYLITKGFPKATAEALYKKHNEPSK